jgi:hypothetical protein
VGWSKLGDPSLTAVVPATGRDLGAPWGVDAPQKSTPPSCVPRSSGVRNLIDSSVSPRHQQFEQFQRFDASEFVTDNALESRTAELTSQGGRVQSRRLPSIYELGLTAKRWRLGTMESSKAKEGVL